jgi:hypothetical protein
LFSGPECQTFGRAARNEMRGTSAADLKFLHHLPQTRSGTSNR